MGMIKKLIKIEKECNKNSVLKEKIEEYILKKGNPTSKQDAKDFIAFYEKVK